MNEVRAVIEMPKDTRYKYELKDGILVLDRVLNRPIPFNYGFVPDTLAQDGDPLDIFVVSFEPIQAGTLLIVDAVGGFDCLDNGVKDEKLIGLLGGEYYPYCVEMIKQYLETYKAGFEVGAQFYEKEAKALIREYQAAALHTGDKS